MPSAKQFKALYDTTGWGPADREAGFYGKALAGSWLTCAAYRDATLVGFGRVISDGVLHAFITEMIVDPGAQGQGIGTHVLQSLVRRCLDRGVTDIQLFCAEGKAPFYARHGFEARAASRPGMQYVGLGVQTSR